MEGEKHTQGIKTPILISAYGPIMCFVYFAQNSTIKAASYFDNPSIY